MKLRAAGGSRRHCLYLYGRWRVTHAPADSLTPRLVSVVLVKPSGSQSKNQIKTKGHGNGMGTRWGEDNRDWRGEYDLNVF